MADVTPRHAFPYLEGTDNANDIDQGFQDLAEDLDDKVVTFTQDAVASIPAAGTSGRLYYADDTAVVYYDNATDWVPVNGQLIDYLDSLPASPINGDTLYFEFQTPSGPTGVHELWAFRYDGLATVWRFCGGRPMCNIATATDTTITATSYADWSYATVDVTVPLDGRYVVSLGGRFGGAGGTDYLTCGVSLNGATPSSSSEILSAVANSPALALSREYSPAGGAVYSAGDVLSLQYKVTAGTGYAHQPYLGITPVYVY